MDIYLDRNKDNEIINNLFKRIIKYYKQKNKKLYNIYNCDFILKKFNKNIHFGIYNIYKPSTTYRKILEQTYKYNFILEQGFINRKKYFSIGINGMGGLSQYKPINCKSDRFDKLEINLKEMKINNDGYILICGQLPKDSQLQSLDTKNINSYNLWIKKIIIHIKRMTNRKIIFRYHPLYYKLRNNTELNIPKDIEIDKNKNLSDSFKNCYCIVAYNSNSLIDAIIEGIPIIVYNNMSLVYNLGANKVRSKKGYNINNLFIPKKEDILQTLYNISYMQFTLDEFENGYAIEYTNSLIKDSDNQ